MVRNISYKPKHRTGIRRKITLFICLSTFMTMFIAASVGYFLGFRLLRNSLGEDQVKIAQNVAVSISELLERTAENIIGYASSSIFRDEILESIAMYENKDVATVKKHLLDVDKKWIKSKTDSPLVVEYLQGKSAERLQDYASLNKSISEIFTTDKFGGLVAASNKTSDFYQADEKWWQEAYNNGKGAIYIGDIEYDVSANILALVIAVPIKGETDEVIGVCKAILNLSSLFKLINNVKIGKSGHAVLVEDNGRILAHQGIEPLSVQMCSDTKYKNLMNNPKKWGLVKNVHLHKGNIFLAHKVVESPFLLARGLIWRVFIVEDAKEVFLPMRRLATQMGIVSVLSIVMLLPFAFFFGGVFVKPIKKLHEATERIGKGDLDYSIEIKTGDEVEQLADSFKEMMTILKNKQDEIREAKVYSENIIDSMIDTLVVIDSDATIKGANRATCNLLGYTEQELIGKDVSIMLEEEILNEIKMLNEIEMLHEVEMLHDIEILNEIEMSAMLISKDFKILKVNNVFVDSVAFSKEEIIGQYCYKVLHGRDEICQGLNDRCPIFAVVHGERAVVKTHTHFDKDGNQVVAYVSAAPVIDSSGGVFFYLHLEKKYEKKEAEHLKNKESMKQITDDFEKYTKKIADKIREKYIFRKVGFNQQIKEGLAQNRDIMYKTKKGDKIPVNFSGSVMRDKNGRFVGIVGVAHDMRKRQELIANLEKAKLELEQWSKTLEKKVEERTSDLKKAQEATLHILEDLQVSKDELEEKTNKLNETLVKSEKSRDVMISMLEDNNTIRKKLEANLKKLKDTQSRLVQSEKLAALGQLVSSVAHEVNNPLMIISGRAQLLLMEEIENKDIEKTLKIITGQCERAKEIIQRMLKFSKLSKEKEDLKEDVEETNINEAIEFALGLVEHQFSLNNVKIIREYDKEIPAIKADEKQLHEVFLNFLNNSAQAMSEKGGSITIYTFKKDDKIVVKFKDTGGGISKEDLEKIFDPFFTTKEQGTGLGLSVCYGIIKAHGGNIYYESKLGVGTTGIIELPL